MSYTLVENLGAASGNDCEIESNGQVDASCSCSGSRCKAWIKKNNDYESTSSASFRYRTKDQATGTWSAWALATEENAFCQFTVMAGSATAPASFKYRLRVDCNGKSELLEPRKGGVGAHLVSGWG